MSVLSDVPVILPKNAHRAQTVGCSSPLEYNAELSPMRDILL